VADRIVVEVVERRPAVALRADRPLDSTEKYFSAPRLILPIPRVRGPPVEAADPTQQVKHVRCFHQDMVVVREDAPSEDAICSHREGFKKPQGKFAHALRAASDDRMVLIAGSRQMKSMVPIAGPMLGRMPGMSPDLSPDEPLPPLRGSQFAPGIASSGHAEVLAQNALYGTQFPEVVRSEFRIYAAAFCLAAVADAA